AAGRDQKNFKVVVAYEDFFTGEQAKATIDRLLQQFEWRHNIALTLWHFDVLKEPALNEIAIRDAAQADMVVVAVDANSELPAEVTNWLEQWTPWKTKGEGVLVALLNPSVVDSEQQS